jgi:phytoene dehydrogenase-like protein
MTNPDILIVGAGHNGLVTAAYLARAGKSVLVLEKQPVPGGQLAGRELLGPGGGLVGLHSSGQLRPDIVRDLDLAKHGLAASTVGASAYVSALPDGGDIRLVSAPNDAATLESIRALSAKDAARWPEFVAFMNTAAGFLDAAYRTPMPRLPKLDWRHEGLPLASLAWKLRGLGRTDMFRVIRSLSMSAIEFTEEWFESEPLKAAIGALGIHGQTLGSMSAGTGYILVHHWLNRGGLAHCGTSANLQQITDGLVAALRANGGQVRTSAGVAQVLVEGQRAIGVRLDNGEEIRAKTVVSAADPRHTLLDLVGAAELPPEFVWQTQSIKMRGSVAKVHALTDGSHGLPGGTVVIAPTLKYLERAYDASKYGEISGQPYLEVTTSGPVVSIHVQFAPYKLRVGDWGTQRGPLERVAIDTLSARYPAFARSIQRTATLSPRDIEQGWGLTEGDLNHGQLILDQLFFMRPLPGWSNHLTPIDGLFLCGSGGHGGGGVSGAAGRNAARQILKFNGR